MHAFYANENAGKCAHFTENVGKCAHFVRKTLPSRITFIFIDLYNDEDLYVFLSLSSTQCKNRLFVLSSWMSTRQLASHHQILKRDDPPTFLSLYPQAI